MLSSKDYQNSLQEECTGYELRPVVGKGEGIFATRTFRRNELVMLGVILKSGVKNDSHAIQVGENEFSICGVLNSKPARSTTLVIQTAVFKSI